jgi:hypothetical protein
LLDPLGSNDLPSRDKVRKVVRAILERKYGLSGDYVQMVVESIKDDPIKLREPRYTRPRAAQKGVERATSEPRIALVLNDEHTIHHVQDRGYVEAPVRIRSILAELNASGLFERMPATRYSDRHIRAVHDGRLVDYIRKASLMAGPKKSIYPYVFPTRNPARPPKDETGARRLLLHRHLHAAQSERLSRRALSRGLRADGCRRRCSRAPISPMRWYDRQAITPRRAPSAAFVISTTARSRPIFCRDTARSRSSTSTTITATASRRSSITAADVLTVLDPRPSKLRLSVFLRLPRRDRHRRRRWLQSQHPAAGAHHSRAAPERCG